MGHGARGINLLSTSELRFHYFFIFHEAASSFVRVELLILRHAREYVSYEFACLRFASVGGPLRFVRRNGGHLIGG